MLVKYELTWHDVSSVEATAARASSRQQHGARAHLVQSASGSCRVWRQGKGRALVSMLATGAVGHVVRCRLSPLKGRTCRRAPCWRVTRVKSPAAGGGGGGRRGSVKGRSLKRDLLSFRLLSDHDHSSHSTSRTLLLLLLFLLLLLPQRKQSSFDLHTSMSTLFFHLGWLVCRRCFLSRA